jgi:hypothetical protein
MEGEPRLGAVYRRGFAATRFRAMELITIPSGCHRSGVLSTSMPTSVPIRQKFGQPLSMMLAATALVLMIACANLGNNILR